MEKKVIIDIESSILKEVISFILNFEYKFLGI